MSLLIQIGMGSLLFVIAFTFWAAAQSSAHGGQSMRDSVMEAWTNIGIGFGINYFANLIVLPLDGYHISLGSAFWVGAIFTGISVVRQIVLRRIFNWRMVRKQGAA